MKITNQFLTECESLIASGDTGIVVKKLRAMSEFTDYKNELLTLNSRWNKLSREQMNGTLSRESYNLENSKLSQDLIKLVDALSRELAGEKFEHNILEKSKNDNFAQSSLFKTYLPILLTAIAT